MWQLCKLLLLLLPICNAWSGWTTSERSSQQLVSRRDSLAVLVGAAGALSVPARSGAEEIATEDAIEVFPSGDAKKLFSEGQVLELQGNVPAAQRAYTKVTKISPRFVFGWSNLGNTQVAMGNLDYAEQSYSEAIKLCRENLKQADAIGFSVVRCDDLYVLLLNRGSLRLNTGREKDALDDLTQASSLRGRPDAVVAQNLARAKELNGMYGSADKDYSLAISMNTKEVSPFWLRAALVKFQLGEVPKGFEVLKRVEKRFPEAPEVRAAYAIFLAAQGDRPGAERKLLEIPDVARKNYVNDQYLHQTIAWPPQAIQTLAEITTAVGDNARFQPATN